MRYTYTQHDKDTLTKNYPTMGAGGCVELLPHLSLSQIRKKVVKMGLYRDTEEVFSDGDINILQEFYQTLGSQGCSQLLPLHSVSQIGKKANSLGLTRGFASFSKSDVTIIKEHYPQIGAEGCVDKLNGFTIGQISAKAGKLGVKMSKEFKKCKRVDNYTHPVYTPPLLNSNICYLLGFIWGDGYMYEHKNARSCTYSKIEIVAADAPHLFNILDLEGLSYSSYERQRSNRKRQVCITITDFSFNKFLCDNDYQLKSSVGCGGILNNIPPNMYNTFLLGLIDADGCWYWNQKYTTRQFSICAAYEYDWSPICSMFDKLDIKYSVINRVQGNHRHSIIRVTGLNNLRLIQEYVYTDDFSNYLPRKFEKSLICVT
jgi:hypothetical protein